MVEIAATETKILHTLHHFSMQLDRRSIQRRFLHRAGTVMYIGIERRALRFDRGSSFETTSSLAGFDHSTENYTDRLYIPLYFVPVD